MLFSLGLFGALDARNGIKHGRQTVVVLHARRLRALVRLDGVLGPPFVCALLGRCVLALENIVNLIRLLGLLVGDIKRRLCIAFVVAACVGLS